jgi:hypothetical protein
LAEWVVGDSQAIDQSDPTGRVTLAIAIDRYIAYTVPALDIDNYAQPYR